VIALDHDDAGAAVGVELRVVGKLALVALAVLVNHVLAVEVEEVRPDEVEVGAERACIVSSCAEFGAYCGAFVAHACTQFHHYMWNGWSAHKHVVRRIEL
jgi:hypothetical protein